MFSNDPVLKTQSGLYRVIGYAVQMRQLEDHRGVRRNAFHCMPLMAECPTPIETTASGYLPCVTEVWAEVHHGVIVNLHHGPKPELPAASAPKEN